jgi:cytochrome P450
MIPLFKNMLRSKRTGDNIHPLTHLYNDDVGKWCGVYVFFMTNDPCVSVMDPKIVQAMCTTHNMQFDKHPLVLNLVNRLLGGGILFSQTTANWKKRRNAISPAFYKGKLIGLIELAKGVVEETVTRWKSLSKAGRTRIDFMDEIGMMHVKILLKCALGYDVAETEMDFEEHGKLGKATVAHALRTTFHDCINRMSDPHIVIFPFLADFYLTPAECALRRNCERLRDLILKMVHKRRADN